MPDLVPADQRIDRHALERIIQRAAELQAREREIGEGLTEAELMQLGDEVGIPGPYLRQALLEERGRSVLESERGVAVWLAGPHKVAAQRTISGERRPLETALNRWMAEGELLQVKRRYPDGTSWEPQQGVFASIKRSLELGGREYILARAREVVGQVVTLDEGRCHVQLVADLGNTLTRQLAGAAVVAGAGTLATGTLVTLGFFVPFAVIPVIVAVPGGFAVARNRRRSVERVQVALEQVLDRLQHSEINPATQVRGSRRSAFGRIADEIKKNLGA